MVSNVDDHLRNHGFLRHDTRGWTLSPAYDLNPVPTDVKARILTTRITPDEATCSLDLVEEAAGYFALSLPEARRIIREVVTATAEWRAVARNHGLRKAEIDRMASAFEHEDSKRALTRG
jgi:serine/threonine-protein kinase HipA